MQQIGSTAESRQFDTRNLADEFFNVLGILRRGWRLVLIAVVICVVAATVYLTTVKPTYTAQTRLLVLQSGGRPINVAGAMDPLSYQASMDLLSTHMIVIRSSAVVDRALEESGIRGLSVTDVLMNLKVSRPDETANVLDLSYKAEASDEAVRVLGAIVDSYKKFVAENYRQNASEIVSFITTTRDELYQELEALERQYIEIRRENGRLNAGQGSRPFIARRLDQWDQTANQAMIRALQLKSQLELAQQLAQEGAGTSEIANALNQLADVSGDSGAATPAAAQGGTTGLLDQVLAELAHIAERRRTTELLIEKLRAEIAESARAEGDPIDEETARRRFEADPRVAEIRQQIRQAKAERDRAARVVRRASDPAMKRHEERIKAAEHLLSLLWQEHRSYRESGAMLSGNEAIRQAEAELLALKAQEAALSERAKQIQAEQIAALRREREQLAQVHGPEHEAVADLDDRIAKAERGQSNDRLQAASGLIESLRQSLEAVEEMRAEIRQRFEEDLAASQEAEIALLEEEKLRTELERQRMLVDSVVAQLKQAEFGRDFEGVSARVIQPPTALTPRSRTAFLLAVALIGGCLLGGGAAFVADLLDPRLRSLTVMRSALDVPILAAIPHHPTDPELEMGGVELLSHLSPRCVLAESYKSARTKLEFLRRNRTAQVLLVSSPNPGEGKTTTASNLAISLAHAGRRVLLIDGDLRKPSLHAIYQLDPNRGLTSILGQRAPANSVIQPTSVENLEVITAGPIVLNPAEQLASRHLGELINELRPSYDLVIIDSSPLLAVTDPSIISASADALLLVARMEASQRQDIERVSELIVTLGIPVLGAVVNGVTRRHLNYGTSRSYYDSPYGPGPTEPPLGLTSPPHPTAALEPSGDVPPGELGRSLSG